MAAHWSEAPVLVFDLETTGVDPTTARIVTHAMAFLYPDGRVEDVATGIVNSGVPIPPEAAAVHGITDEIAAERGRPTADALLAISRGLALAAGNGIPVVAFNAAYDLTVAYSEATRAATRGTLEAHQARRLLAQLTSAYVIDPLVIDKAVDKYRSGRRRLENVCRHYGVALDNAHEATADAIAAGRVAYALPRKHPTPLMGLTLKALHERQITWAAEQAASLRDYFARNGKTAEAATVKGGWPIRQ